MTRGKIMQATYDIFSEDIYPLTYIFIGYFPFNLYYQRIFSLYDIFSEDIFPLTSIFRGYFPFNFYFRGYFPFNFYSQSRG